MVLGMETLRAPAWGGVLGGGAPACLNAQPGDRACLSTLLFIGQDMYTPNLDRPPFSYIGWEFERPYAAWLYVGGEGRRVSSRALRTYALSLGVTGAPALGKLAQAVAHEISARYTTKATGWETQVGFEPGVLLGLRQTVLALRWAPGGVGVLDLAPSEAKSTIAAAASWNARSPRRPSASTISRSASATGPIDDQPAADSYITWARPPGLSRCAMISTILSWLSALIQLYTPLTTTISTSSGPIERS